MSTETTKSKKALETGMYECEKLTGLYKGDKAIYHSSTAETLQAKGIVKVVKKLKNYTPATMKK
jgi:hypothetical protein